MVDKVDKREVLALKKEIAELKKKKKRGFLLQPEAKPIIEKMLSFNLSYGEMKEITGLSTHWLRKIFKRHDLDKKQFEVNNKSKVKILSEPKEVITKMLLKGSWSIKEMSEAADISREDVYKCLDSISRNKGQQFNFFGNPRNPIVRVSMQRDRAIADFKEPPYYRPFRQVGFLFGTLLGSNFQQMKIIRTIYFVLCQGWKQFPRSKKLELDFMIHAGGAVYGKITSRKKQETFLNFATASEIRRIESENKKRQRVGQPLKKIPPKDWEAQRDYFVSHWPNLKKPQEDLKGKKLNLFKTYLMSGAEERSFLSSLDKVDIIRAINAKRRHDLIPRREKFDFFPIKNITLMVINALKGTYRGSYTPGARAQNTVDAAMAEAPTLVTQYGLENVPEIIVVAGDGKAMDFGSYAGTRVISLPVLNTYFKDNTAEGAPSFGFTWLHIPFDPKTDKVLLDEIEVNFIDLTHFIETPGY